MLFYHISYCFSMKNIWFLTEGLLPFDGRRYAGRAASPSTADGK